MVQIIFGYTDQTKRMKEEMKINSTMKWGFYIGHRKNFVIPKKENTEKHEILEQWK